MFDLRKIKWIDHPKNPLISLPPPQYMLIDPHVIPPKDSPDKKFHMFTSNAHYFHFTLERLTVKHYISKDGIKWESLNQKVCEGIRPYVFKEGKIYYMFYEEIPNPYTWKIALRTSKNLINWSEPQIILSPELRWEFDPLSFPMRFIIWLSGGFLFGGFSRNKMMGCTTNPCLVKVKNKYRLYYSAGWRFTPDNLVVEPAHISFAESKRIDGPYKKRSQPILSPEPDTHWVNHARGALRVIPPKGKLPWFAFNNTISVHLGTTTSELHLLESKDGIRWKDVFRKAVVAPSPKPSWKSACVYTASYVEHKGKPLLYFNARDGGFTFFTLTPTFPVGRERIGMAVGKRI